jgi:hypothetical protein
MFFHRLAALSPPGGEAAGAAVLPFCYFGTT